VQINQKKQTMSNVSNHNNDLLIPQGVTFVGSINVPGFAQINGDISGEITCKELEVGEQGNIRGKVQAQAIQVHGKLENDINCKGLMKIHKTGKVSGKLSYAELDIDRGGQFVGTMNGTKT
jgi:cytoskeletal protein CcmA (bactofilin family)